MKHIIIGGERISVAELLRNAEAQAEIENATLKEVSLEEFEIFMQARLEAGQVDEDGAAFAIGSAFQYRQNGQLIGKKITSGHFSKYMILREEIPN